MRIFHAFDTTLNASLKSNLWRDNLRLPLVRRRSCFNLALAHGIRFRFRKSAVFLTELARVGPRNVFGSTSDTLHLIARRLLRHKEKLNRQP